MKKVYELSILCNCEVALIIFDSEGRLHEFSNCDVDEITKNYVSTADKPTCEEGKAGDSNGIKRVLSPPSPLYFEPYILSLCMSSSSYSFLIYEN